MFFFVRGLVGVVLGELSKSNGLYVGISGLTISGYSSKPESDS